MSTYTHSMAYLDPHTWTYMQIYKIKYFKHRKLDSVPMRQISYGGRQRLEKCMYNQRKILWQPPRARSKAWSRFSLIVCRRKQLGNLFYLDFRSQGLWTSESSLLQNLSSSAGTMGALGISYTPTIVRIMKEKMVSIAAITSVFFHISISLSTQLSSILCGNEQERAYLPWAWPKPHHALNPPPPPQEYTHSPHFCSAHPPPFVHTDWGSHSTKSSFVFPCFLSRRNHYLISCPGWQHPTAGALQQTIIPTENDSLGWLSTIESASCSYRGQSLSSRTLIGQLTGVSVFDARIFDTFF